MKNLAFYLLLCLASGLHAQQNQTPQHLPKLGPSPTLFDPAQLNDFEPPTVVCLNGLSASISPGGSITIEVTDLLGYVEDNVTPVDQILLSVRRGGTGMGFPLDAQSNPVESLAFDCDDLGDPVAVELWAMDAAGNEAYCTIQILLQDNFFACDSTLSVLLCARTLCGDEAIEELTFIIEGQSNFIPPYSIFGFTNTTGCANILGIIPVASFYTIKAQKDDNPLNGMDEQDFTILSNHINGTQPFTEPWQWVAADANRDGLITLEDSVEFRNLMLGIFQELPNNTAWRFVPNSYQFPSPDPLAQPIPESVTVAELAANTDSIFYGIKIGDLDCSAIPNFTGSPNGARNEPGQQEKTAPPLDPTQLQGPPTDTDPPTVVCLDGLQINLNPTGTLQIWASDLLVSLDDNETPVNEIKIGIRRSGTGTGFPVDNVGNPVTQIVFSCFDLGNQSVELWAIDLHGNADYCETDVLVGDFFGFCDPNNYDSIQVCVTNGCDGTPMEGVFIGLNNNNWLPFQNVQTTGPDGCASIVVHPNFTYSITPDIIDSPKNGLTTYDLLLISRHIAGLEPLDNPYKMIAADANKSGSITTFDLVELRKLLLGTYTELPNNTSWRFVDANFVFPNPLNPFASAFPEIVSTDDTLFNNSYAFTAIKIGDVDCSATFDSLTPPNYPTAYLTLPDTFLTAGQVYDMPIFMAESGIWMGFQFELAFDPQNLNALDVIQTPWAGIGSWNLSKPGRAAASWNSPEQLHVDKNVPIGGLRVQVLQPGLLKDFLSLESTHINPEAYAGAIAEKRSLLLEFVPQFKPSPTPREADKTSASDIVIGLPQPNPTYSASAIPVHLPQPENLRLELYDLSGKRLWLNDLFLDHGDHVLEIPAVVLSAPGMYVWRVRAGDVVGTGKLVRQ